MPLWEESLVAPTVPIPLVPPYFSSTWRLGEHLMASQVFQWRCRTLYTCPNPPEPIFSQLLNSLSSKVFSSPMAQGEPPSLAIAAAVPGHRPAPRSAALLLPPPPPPPRPPAQVSQVCRGGSGVASLPGTGEWVGFPQVPFLSRDGRAG